MSWHYLGCISDTPCRNRWSTRGTVQYLRYKFEDTKIKQVQKFNCFDHVITDDRKCGTEIQRHIGIAEDVIQSYLYFVFIYKCQVLNTAFTIDVPFLDLGFQNFFPPAILNNFWPNSLFFILHKKHRYIHFYILKLLKLFKLEEKKKIFFIRIWLMESKNFIQLCH